MDPGPLADDRRARWGRRSGAHTAERLAAVAPVLRGYERACVVAAVAATVVAAAHARRPWVELVISALAALAFAAIFWRGWARPFGRAVEAVVPAPPGAEVEAGPTSRIIKAVRAAAVVVFVAVVVLVPQPNGLAAILVGAASTLHAERRLVDRAEERLGGSIASRADGRSRPLYVAPASQTGPAACGG